MREHRATIAPAPQSTLQQRFYGLNVDLENQLSLAIEVLQAIASCDHKNIENPDSFTAGFCRERARLALDWLQPKKPPAKSVRPAARPGMLPNQHLQEACGCPRVGQ
jgi:hypothetical protein